jgi:hypothetical protein
MESCPDSPSGLTISDATIDGDTVKVWVSDAVLYTQYDLACGIVTLGGRTANRSAILNCTKL